MAGGLRYESGREMPSGMQELFANRFIKNYQKEMISKPALGDSIRNARRAAGMTQEQLADAANISVMSVRRYESGERLPSLVTVTTIAGILDTKIEGLLDMEDFPAINIMLAALKNG